MLSTFRRFSTLFGVSPGGSFALDKSEREMVCSEENVEMRG